MREVAQQQPPGKRAYQIARPVDRSPPNRTACVYHDINQDTRGTITMIGASSNHPGGVTVVFMDGSVRFIKNTVNIQSWWFLGTRAGGEVVSADSY